MTRHEIVFRILMICAAVATFCYAAAIAIALYEDPTGTKKAPRIGKRPTRGMARLAKRGTQRQTSCLESMRVSGKGQ